jgi:hypothetical protein
LASFQTNLHETAAHGSSHKKPVRLLALSPSQGDALDFLARIAVDMPAAKKTKHSVPSPDRNLISVASLLSVGDFSALRGADLINSANPGSGWQAVLQSHARAPIGPRAMLYKIAHHGSITGHHPDVWSELLASNVSAVLTPWRRGGREVPNAAEIKNINGLTQYAFATSHGSRTRLSTSALPRAIRAHLRIRRVPMQSLDSPFGAVRFRSNNDKTGWACELLGAACHIKQIANRRRRALRK